jgi:hypothetical protein
MKRRTQTPGIFPQCAGRQSPRHSDIGTHPASHFDLASDLHECMLVVARDYGF